MPSSATTRHAACTTRVRASGFRTRSRIADQNACYETSVTETYDVAARLSMAPRAAPVGPREPQRVPAAAVGVAQDETQASGLRARRCEADAQHGALARMDREAAAGEPDASAG